jgi:hypothetical protein
MRHFPIGAVVFAATLSFAAQAGAQSVNAVPDTGTADFGLASSPILNVALNDTVNGAQATLGASGNATISKYNSWPAGLGLNPGNGTVSTGASLAVGQYMVQYQLCDKLSPPDCTTALITVNVINSSINPVAETGSADAGLASRPIANVAANDTVNGAPATLGPSGNAVVMQVDPWPPGIALTPSSGQVSTTTAVPVGQYGITYKLCDLNVPKNCATTIDTVNVIKASVIPNPDSGTADAGIASRPIANVAANDMVNGAPATLGTSGNAAVSPVGTWPAGIALTPSTGAVSTTTSVADGVYSLPYQLCDKNLPPTCATTTDTVTVIRSSVVAVADSGNALAGVASKPIANVAANDTVNGAAATLGSGGNATVSAIGTWTTGIVLNPSTGAVTTSATLPAGNYSVDYQVCDKNQPPNCSATSDTVTVIAASVVANADSGTVISGTASTPIASVTANDSINGAAVRLVTSPNATIAPMGTWPAALSLNTQSGAIKATSALAPGNYFVQYQLCDKATPQHCANATDEVTASALIVALPISGSSVNGTAATPIANVTVTDTVNGAAVVLGSSGNATIAPVGTLPTGITLSTTTGSIRTASSVAVGTYKVSYQLCDRSTPVNCASSFANVIVTTPFPEVLASQYVVGDIEFDWGRNGLYCTACNGGQGNAQYNWTDRNNNLWVGLVDTNTGLFKPVSGHAALVDNSAFFWEDWGNGPEWALSTPPGSQNPISQLVYTRFTPGQSATWQNAGAGMATYSNGAWVTAFLPGAISPGHNTVLPTATQCTSDPQALVVYLDFLAASDMYTEPVSTLAGTAPVLAPIGTIANGIGERWVACTHWLTFQGDVTIGTNTLQQVFWYNNDTQAVQQLTFDPTTKQRAVLFRAPEFLGQQYDYMLMTLAKDNQVQIYRQTGVYANGAPVMSLYNVIYSPDPVQPYIFNPKAFMHCNPTCHTYVLMGLSNQVNSQQTETQPNGLAISNVDPANPMFEVIASTASQPLTQRFDPEYFITTSGPKIYYESLLVLTQTQPYTELGHYFIDTHLGPQSGPCIGSSAEGGLVGPVGQCR